MCQNKLLETRKNPLDQFITMYSFTLLLPFLQSSVDYGFSDNVDPSKIVTDEMLEEEKRLQTKGEKEEEKRLKDTETVNITLSNT